ncbi:MAG TPA: hypothetical protein PLG34_13715 [Spirochaetota bacterium]|nr:hypothetical protein [Spirochaetota bacterium]
MEDRIMENKEASDALHTLLHCSLKDTEFETQLDQFNIVFDYIIDLENKTNNVEVVGKRYTRTIGDKRSIILYVHGINIIGGIEKFTYNLGENLKGHFDITLIYEEGSIEQLKNISKNIKVEKLNSKKLYKADIIIKNSLAGDPENILGRSYKHIIHGNLSELLYGKGIRIIKLWKKASSFICVSEACERSVKELFPRLKTEVLYNLLGTKKEYEKKPREDDKIQLLSATRLTQEKGLERIIELSKRFDNCPGFNYHWKIYTDVYREIDSPNVEICNPKMDVTEDIFNCDYGVQLSSSESFCYFVNECLDYGVPVIVTKWRGVEKFVNESNGHILEMDLSNLDIEKIKKIPKGFKYEPIGKPEEWINYLNNIELGDYKYIPLKVTTEFFDKSVDRLRKKKSIFVTTSERASELLELGYVEEIINSYEYV